MPEEGIELTPNDKLLTSDEIDRIITLFVKAGVNKIRFTGGEPTVRKDLNKILANTNKLRAEGLKHISMTTNGITLHRKLSNYLENGLNSINISLDTLDPFKFQLMTRRKGHDRVLKSIETSLQYNVNPLKLNVVVMKGMNDDEIIDFVEFTRHKNIEVRFIEYMPFDGNKWNSKKLVSYMEMLDRIKEKYPTIVRDVDLPNDTSKAYRVPGFSGRVGFVTSMTEHFCNTCNRLRITADGNLKVCLFGATEINLRDMLRKPNTSDDELYEVISNAISRKKPRHAGMSVLAATKNRPMITIGG